MLWYIRLVATLRNSGTEVVVGSTFHRSITRLAMASHRENGPDPSFDLVRFLGKLNEKRRHIAETACGICVKHKLIVLLICLSSIFCMLLALTSIIASLGILVGSDNQDIESWTTPPSTYLAMFTATANLSVRYAAVHGVVIAWWMRALKGSTLSKLHYDWRSGSS